jgi:hypothetical protein
MKRKRKSRAKNKIQSSLDGALIKAEPEGYSDPPRVELRFAVAARRSALFNAELEEAIDIIARERVYREMLARLGRRLLMAPAVNDDGDARLRAIGRLT